MNKTQLKVAQKRPHLPIRSGMTMYSTWWQKTVTVFS